VEAIESTYYKKLGEIGIRGSDMPVLYKPLELSSGFQQRKARSAGYSPVELVRENTKAARRSLNCATRSLEGGRLSSRSPLVCCLAWRLYQKNHSPKWSASATTSFCALTPVIFVSRYLTACSKSSCAGRFHGNRKLT